MDEKISFKHDLNQNSCNIFKIIIINYSYGKRFIKR